MNALREGVRAAQDNLFALGFYMVALAVFSAIVTTVQRAVPEAVAADPVSAVNLVVRGVAPFYLGVVQAIVFTWMAQEIGRPLWKLSTGEGLRAFAAFWIGVQVVLQWSFWLVVYVARNGDNPDLAFAFFFTFLPLYVLAVPVGASVMYGGRTDRESFAEGVRALGHGFPHTMVVLLFYAVVLFLILYLNETSPDWANPLVSIIDCYFDIVVFGAAWSICANFDHTYDGDDDFDF